MSRQDITAVEWLKTDEGKKAIDLSEKLDATEGLAVAYLAGVSEGISRLDSGLTDLRDAEKPVDYVRS